MAKPVVLEPESLVFGWESSVPGPLTYDEFLDWADEDTLAEWVDGEVCMTSPASKRHQLIKGFLGAILPIYVEQQDLGTVLDAPFQMKIERSGREPDLLFVAHEHQHRLRENYLDGPADVAVEIISPESRRRDEREKFYEYEAAGVREYWLIDPVEQRATFFRLDKHGSYRTVWNGREGVYRSTIVKGFWLRLEWLWPEPMPRVLDALREMEVV